MNDRITEHDDTLAPAKRWFQAVALGAAVMAFCLQPLLPLVDGREFFSNAVLLAAGLTRAATWMGNEQAWRDPLGAYNGNHDLVGHLRHVHDVQRAREAARINDVRCLAIQRDMLSAHPRIAAGPDKFQALGCRPQGTDTRIFVPPTDRERAAGKALPQGGYPPPR
ncbi:hypothetical protein [Sphingomonas sp.]|jgi:hypothetical protein|uniref:hypothetical protein n=1 Tax=Sphingomonas sp. TaxID=28214 RepID=UPI00263314B8|nr:hypothetical protein [Sphingomonas sp.]MDF2493268.1 hypothetical protein [Sphingomonas sp.]